MGGIHGFSVDFPKVKSKANIKCSADWQEIRAATGRFVPSTAPYFFDGLGSPSSSNPFCFSLFLPFSFFFLIRDAATRLPCPV